MSSRNGPPGKGRPVRWRSFLKNTVADVLRAKKDWVETDSDTEWDLFWADTGWVHQNFDTMHLNDWQRINHFRNHYELTRKDLLVKNLKRARRQLEREDRHAEASEYNFFPSTFVLPSEYRMFVEEFKKIGGVWIMKPIGRAQGKGIFLFNKLSQISEWKKASNSTSGDDDTAETYIAQRYLENPYLVGGKKFDLRLYALVLSYTPLKVYFYRSGFARFSNTRFTMNKSDLSNTYIHLTNVAIQKHAPGYDKSVGMKWAIRNMKMYMTSKHGAKPVNDMFHSIQNLIIRSLLAVQQSIINDKHCYEVYGYDVMIDRELKPWLIEVNASPSLSADTPDDYDLKYKMLQDVFHIVDVEQKRGGTQDLDLNVGGFDLIWDGGPVMRFEKQTSLPTMLGCMNARERDPVVTKTPKGQAAS